ncbi:hypothetical protein EVAR_69519_1 [Eumeta japonica]|uniref:Uncharacterized protein n=1 Tax=Eumeta variegata TaxID=151549 RepID=A0A4C2A0V4_EUMVA|nr:hypothetical protein EVAR_69519_1 [Eumeta japonica]
MYELPVWHLTGMVQEQSILHKFGYQKVRGRVWSLKTDAPVQCQAFAIKVWDIVLAKYMNCIATTPKRFDRSCGCGSIEMSNQLVRGWRMIAFLNNGYYCFAELSYCE